jgi:hypothetical protein
MIVNSNLCGYLVDVLEMDFCLRYAAIPVRNKEWPEWGFRTFFSFHRNTNPQTRWFSA